MALNSYSTGTISIGANATAVVGVSTLWNEANARAGDTLIVAGHQVLIEDNTDATHLVIDAWPYSAVAGGTAYKIVHTSPLRFAGAQAMIDVDALVTALDTDGYIVVVKPTETVPNPSYGDENQFAFQWGTGKLWTKSGGVWVFVGIFKGFAPKGSWSGATAYVVGDIVSSAGSSYLCVADHTNHLPPNVTYWMLLSSTPWGLPAAWVTATAYSATAPASVVVQAGTTYVCIVSHTSGTFATDLAASKWLKISGADGPASWSVPTAWLTATAYVIGPPASVVVQGGESYVCLVSHTSGTFATDLAASRWIKITQKGSGDVLSSNNLSDLANLQTALANLGARFGQCQLSKVSTNLVLMSKNGNFLTVAGVPCIVPDAGVSLAPTGLTPSTNYYIYATASGGVINALEASTTDYAISTTAGNKGVVIKSGDNTRTLVGFARIITGPAWQDTEAQRFVRSFFNDPGIYNYNQFTASRSTASTSFVEVNTEIRIEALLWSGETWDVTENVSGLSNSSTSSNSFSAIGIDGTTPERNGILMTLIGSGVGGMSVGATARSLKTGLSEGVHYATLLGKCDIGTVAWSSSADGNRTAMLGRAQRI